MLRDDKIRLLAVAIFSFGILAPAQAHARDGELKSWYIDIGLGYASPSLGSNSNLQSFANQRTESGATALPITAEISVYWPVSNHLLLGISDTGFGESYTLASAAAGGIVSSNLFFSVEHFPFSESASGFFIRADAGFGLLGTSTGSAFFPTSYTSSAVFHAGTGFSIPIGSVRLPLMAGYYYVPASTGAVGAFQIALSVMW